MDSTETGVAILKIVNNKPLLSKIYFFLYFGEQGGVEYLYVLYCCIVSHNRRIDAMGGVMFPTGFCSQSYCLL